MYFDPHNHINKLCDEGMAYEGEGRMVEASHLFLQAWNEASGYLEKFTAAHYVARHQKTIEDKLKWDQTALELALQVRDDGINGLYPSLYLNIAKCYEDLHDSVNATKNYQLAFSFSEKLPDDGYGKMIRSGIEAGLKRMKFA